MSTACNHDVAFGGGPVLDQDTIAGLIELGGEDDPSLLLELVDLFLDDGTDRMQQIAQARDAGDKDTIEKMAHALKSASANIGALCFSKTCRELEMSAKAPDRSDVDSLVDTAM